jgi:hypothetical protein
MTTINQRMSAREYLLELYLAKVQNAVPETYLAMIEDVLEKTIEQYPELSRKEKENINDDMFEFAKNYCQDHRPKIDLKSDCRPFLAIIMKRLDAVGEPKGLGVKK